jgi:hypothetical protein
LDDFSEFHESPHVFIPFRPALPGRTVDVVLVVFVAVADGVHPATATTTATSTATTFRSFRGIAGGRAPFRRPVRKGRHAWHAIFCLRHRHRVSLYGCRSLATFGSGVAATHGWLWQLGWHWHGWWGAGVRLPRDPSQQADCGWTSWT